MTSYLQIVDSIDTISKRINSAIAELANDIIQKNISTIVSQVKNLIPNWIQAQPEIQSLLTQSSSSLIGQFGITGSTQGIVTSITQSVVNSTEVKFVKYRSNLSGGLELRFQPSTFTNLLSLQDGHTIYNGGDLHWLYWLLKRGDEIIITNYQYNPQTGLGRSGLGNMIESGAFRVPPEFAGTEKDNFITRAFLGQTQESQITNILQKILQ